MYQQRQITRTGAFRALGTRAWAAAGLLALLAFLVAAGARNQATGAERIPPSFVVIQTDDQTLDGLYASYESFEGTGQLRTMPNTLNLIAKRGMTFNRYYVSYPLCCPSRVTLLTGRYAHNHNVRGNVPPNGGFTGFTFRGAMNHNLAVWLNQAGYRTIHIGKFLNGYGDEPYDNGTIVPPGWDAWHTVLKADTHHYFYGYRLNDNGTIDGPFGDSGSWDTREYGVRDDIGCPFAPTNGLPCFYESDVLTRIAAEEITGTPEERPFYLQLDYTAPHGDFRRPAGPEPAPRNYDWFKGAPLPHDRSEGFDEGNVRDKPRFIRNAPHLSLQDKHTYRVYWQKQLESLRSIDDGIKQVIDTLGALHRLRNTYIIFTSDNGFFFGEHRLIGGKFLAYEPSTHLPFLIRGPGIRPNTQSGELVGNIDIAPTILELAGAEADKSIDGRSMVPFLHDPALRTRRPFLFESFVQTADVNANGAISTSTVDARPGTGKAHASIVAPPKDYEGIRLGPYKYIEWPDGEKELYDINKDPNELNSLVRVPNFFPIRAFLHAQLVRLENCVGRVCREVTPKFPLTKKEQRRVDKQRREEERRKQKEQEEKRHHKRIG
ncbi:MAG TPA: sulfatase-like hydrolase/transferase [Solirubrobacterales bacterium]|nr:sulfatase-like hydrolase/transferase [Solirubrobacterales bacterium]